MHINLIESDVPGANSAYDSYHCFYYNAEVRASSAGSIPWLKLREDTRIYFNDSTGVTFDLICNEAGIISSIAFRQKLVPGELYPEFDHLLPVPEKTLLGVVVNLEIEKYDIELIQPLLLSSPTYGDAILVLLGELLPKNWYPISKSAFIGTDMENKATAFLFFNVEFTLPE